MTPAQFGACRHVRLVHLVGAKKKDGGLEGRFFCGYEYITLVLGLRADTGMFILFIHMFSGCFEPQNI
jgi:hypothetical protein